MARRKYPELVTRETTRMQNGKRRPVYVTPTPNGEIVRARQGPKTIELMSKSDYDAIVLGRRHVEKTEKEEKRAKKLGREKMIKDMALKYATGGAI